MNRPARKFVGLVRQTLQNLNFCRTSVEMQKEDPGESKQ